MGDHRFSIEARGPFDLARSIDFLAQWPAARNPPDGAALRFAFCPDDDWRPVGVRLTQAGPRIEGEATGPGSAAPDLAAQVSRILSLDTDGTPLEAIARRDPRVAALVRAAPGLRPVCFWTPWEAACWAVLTQRSSMRTAAAIKERTALAYGDRIAVDGRELTAFPSPRTVLEAPGLPGVNPVKLERIRGLATAALDGVLTARALRAVPAGEALATLLRLPGIGAFSAALILIRGAGAPDVFTMSEPRLLARIRSAYGLPADATDDDYRAVAGQWRPLRSWVGFLIRAISETSED
ncbi:DNA-3-methyladenine glycosylase II [Actinoplanes sp. NBRC 14428]|nr:DNA-3-methyladenine glycosylase II [Actinoplanes sp. NBRC 14428]